MRGNDRAFPARHMSKLLSLIIASIIEVLLGTVRGVGGTNEGRLSAFPDHLGYQPH
jgi:hypothetical protein